MKWNDDYWPLVMKIYKSKPEGVKPMFNKKVVDLALHLHIPPQEVHKKLVELHNPKSAFLKKLHEDYSSAAKLNNAVNVVIQKEGLGTGGKFYEGIELIESWEKDFYPLEEDKRLTPVMLIIILDLYFHLTPTTMVAETKEVRDVAKLLSIPMSLVLRVMELYKFCDPYVKSDDLVIDNLLFSCSSVWYKYCNDYDHLTIVAKQMKEYFKRN